ncbi:MAG: L-lactate dehydrogenase [Desulfobacteraceae bacterium]|nr:L-lactate dehydrogenase [Desulfobacteraceae bacterium]
MTQQKSLRDPVCGMRVQPDTPHRYSHKNREFWFCSKNCQDKFRDSPESYDLSTGTPLVSVRRQPCIDRVAVIGMGHVGSTFAYALLLSGLAEEIVLINRTREVAEGEAMDLNHAVPFAHATEIWAGDYEDCAEADIIVITAGAAQSPGETRLDLMKKNTAIFKKIVPRVLEHNPDSLLLITTNPVDILTYAAGKISGLPPRRVIGSGTVLDTSRFKYMIGQHYGVDPQSVQAYIIGEHGDSEVPVWSLADVAGMHLHDFCHMQGCVHDQSTMEEIFQSTRDAAYRIIERKGATHYAIATGLVHLVKAILRDQSTVFSVSSLIEDYYGINDVCLSLPSVVNRQGIAHVLRLELSDAERKALQHSASVLKEHLSQLDL